MTKAAIEAVLTIAKQPEDAIVLNIGIALQYAFAPTNVRYSAPYPDMGKELWTAAAYELHGLLCDSADAAPKRWLEDVVSGDARELGIAVLTLLVASLETPLSIAVPITALFIKRQLLTFCSSLPTKPARTLKEIINAHRRRHDKAGKP